ncbi:MAG: hypothetical protein AABZ06_03345 [Bdellovibrionota bacterium]
MKLTNKFKTLLMVIGLTSYVNANAADTKMTILPVPQPGDNYRCLIPEGCPMEHRIQVLECVQEKVIYDAGVQVHIDRVIPLNRDRAGVKSRLEAVVTESTLVGPRLVGKFTVKESISELIGSPVYYIGRDFELEVRATVTPVEGRMPAHLAVDTKRSRISEDMLCLYSSTEATR